MAKPSVGTHEIGASSSLSYPRPPNSRREHEVRRTDQCPRHFVTDPHSGGPEPGVRSFAAAIAAPSSARCRPAATIAITARTAFTRGTSTAMCRAIA